MSNVASRFSVDALAILRKLPTPKPDVRDAIADSLEEQLEAAELRVAAWNATANENFDRATELLEQLEAQRRVAGQLNRALRDAMAFIQPEIAVDYPRWEVLLGISKPTSVDP